MKKREGFTLIEILVVISIAGLLVTMGIASYMEFNRRQILDQASKTILNDLRYIQSRASVGDKGPTDTCSSPLTGWYFEVVDSNHYELYGNCGSDFSLKSTALPTNLSFVSPVAGTKILFKPLGLGVDLGVNPSMTITIQYSTDTSKQKSIILTTSGTIN